MASYTWPGIIFTVAVGFHGAGKKNWDKLKNMGVKRFIITFYHLFCRMRVIGCIQNNQHFLA
jgi:hypothetical protein